MGATNVTRFLAALLLLSCVGVLGCSDDRSRLAALEAEMQALGEQHRAAGVQIEQLRERVESAEATVEELRRRVDPPATAVSDPSADDGVHRTGDLMIPDIFR